MKFSLSCRYISVIFCGGCPWRHTFHGGILYPDFAKRVKKVTSFPIASTGGFETREQAVQALLDGAAKAVSLARAMVLDPSLANTWLSEQSDNLEFPKFVAPPRGGVSAWYSMRLTALGADSEDQFDQSSADALVAYDARDADRCEIWCDRGAMIPPTQAIRACRNNFDGAPSLM